MKVFGDAETKKKFDQWAAFIVAIMIYSAALLAIVWTVGFAFHLVFKAFGVA